MTMNAGNLEIKKESVRNLQHKNSFLKTIFRYYSETGAE